MARGLLGNFLRFSAPADNQDAYSAVARGIGQSVLGRGIPQGTTGGKAYPTDYFKEAQNAYRSMIPDTTMVDQPLPPSMPTRGRLPERPKQGLLDLIPQLLAGAGDVIGSRGGVRTNYLGGIMGQQEADRRQTFEDQLRAAAANWEAKRGGYEDQWRRYGATTGMEREKYGRQMARAGLEMQGRRGALGEATELEQMAMLKKKLGLTEGAAQAAPLVYKSMLKGELANQGTAELARAKHSEYMKQVAQLAMTDPVKAQAMQKGLDEALNERLGELTSAERRTGDFSREENWFEPKSWMQKVKENPARGLYATGPALGWIPGIMDILSSTGIAEFGAPGTSQKATQTLDPETKAMYDNWKKGTLGPQDEAELLRRLQKR